MRILVGYDGSSLSKRALKVASFHGRHFNGRIDLLTSFPGGEDTSADQIQKAEEEIRYASELVRREGVPCEGHVLVRGGSPAEDILRFAHENQVDEIVLGVKSKSKVGKFLFGSIVQRVALEALCPVVLVK
jgi:nucleotide-binding universal stress UspA family protein